MGDDSRRRTHAKRLVHLILYRPRPNRALPLWGRGRRCRGSRFRRIVREFESVALPVRVVSKAHAYRHGLGYSSRQRFKRSRRPNGVQRVLIIALASGGQGHDRCVGRSVRQNCKPHHHDRSLRPGIVRGPGHVSVPRGFHAARRPEDISLYLLPQGSGERRLRRVKSHCRRIAVLVLIRSRRRFARAGDDRRCRPRRQHQRFGCWRRRCGKRTGGHRTLRNTAANQGAEQDQRQHAGTHPSNSHLPPSIIAISGDSGKTSANPY